MTDEDKTKQVSWGEDLVADRIQKNIYRENRRIGLSLDVEEIINDFYKRFENTGIICCPIKSCKDESCGMAGVEQWLRQRLS